MPQTPATLWFLGGGMLSAVPLAGTVQLSPALFWLVTGAVLCLVEVPVPTAFTAFTMGLSAIAVSLICWIFPIQFGLQVFLWMGLSTGGVFLTRRLLPKRKVYTLEDSKEAETLTEILPGEAGRVLYEGNSWRARCEDDKLAIPPNQKVCVVRREGTTLIVVPEHLLHS
jgi:membrane protein implicated in regulation of membrane protease activity